MKKIFLVSFFIAVLGAVLSGCQMLPLFQLTPVPLETKTPQLSLNQITEIPTLPPITPTPTLPASSRISYSEPGDIFNQVLEENLPEHPFQSVVIFGTVSDFIQQTDVWGNVTGTGGFTLEHHSGTEFSVNCDDFCFCIDAKKNLISSEKLVEGSEVIVFGASNEDATEINADMVAVHVIREDYVPHAAEIEGLPSDVTYTEYELESFPRLNPIALQAAAATSTPFPTATAEATEETSTDQNTYDYNYGYGYGYDYYGYSRPTSTPNRPQRTPTPEQTDIPEPTATPSLDEHLNDRLNHSLEDRTDYAVGSYGEYYSSYMEYDQDFNRDPSYPTRADMNVTSNGYDFVDFWFPYVENPMFTNWGIICYAGDWYMPVRLTVDINADPNVTDLVFSDRTIRSNQNYDKLKGYLRSFGHSIFDKKLFYFYQTDDGYGISIGGQDYNLGFDDIPFGYVGTYTEINPFYADDLITFFGHRGGKWYYVEINSND